MANYLCAVSGDFPENYQIGIQANLWGVEEKYKQRIEKVRVGDTLVFIVGGLFRSIHRVESESFLDDKPLWPEKDSSLFPYRIKISDPLMTGQIPVKKIAQEISFMAGKVWGWTVKGASGVFNDKLTTSDLKLIQNQMEKKAAKTQDEKQQLNKPSERQITFFKLYEKDVEDHISQIIPQMGLEIYVDKRTGKTGRQYSINVGRIDLLCIDKSSEDYVIVELKKGEAPNETLLQILRYMSWVRQNLADSKNVRGIILTESVDNSLVEIVKEVPNVSLRYYKVNVKLV